MLLEELSNAFGPSGNEDEVRRILARALKDKVDELSTDALGNLIGTTAYTKGTVTAATFDRETASLWIGDQEVPLSTIIEVAGAGN